MSQEPRANAGTAKVTPEVLAEITAAINAIRYGSIEITVHDGKVTQIERREKVRFQDQSQPTGKTAAKSF